MRYLVIIIGAVLVNNFVLSRFLGCCPFLGVSKKTETALGMSGAVVFVMTVAAAVTWLLDHYLLRPLGLDYIHTLVFILVIAALVQFIDIAMKRFLPPLHSALGIFLPLITTNCAVLGVAELNTKNNTPFFESVLFSFAAAQKSARSPTQGIVTMRKYFSSAPRLVKLGTRSSSRKTSPFSIV